MPPSFTPHSSFCECFYTHNHAFQALWEAFLAYRAPTYEHWAARNPQAAAEHEAAEPVWSSSKSSNAERAMSDTTVHQLNSSEEAEFALSLSIHHLQKLGTRVPEAVRTNLKRYIQDLDSSSASQSLQHFLAFFEAWRSGQCNLALESLHRYFDYSLMGKEGGQEGGNLKVYYQYALLHQSVLHADFGAWEQSVASMEECIAIARENQDTACLNFALSWLLYLRQTHPGTCSSCADAELEWGRTLFFYLTAL